MDIRFYNSLTHRLEPFSALQPPDVYVYNCGPTVYDYATLGNFRSFLFADLLRRTLELAGYTVHQVMNITDVGHMTEDTLADGGGEDKMELAARRLKEAKKSGQAPVEDPNNPFQIADYYAQVFLEDARQLGLKIAFDDARQRPRATQYIPQMQALIQRLLDTGHAYRAADGTVYYSVESFPAYGQLSGNTLDKLRGGAGGRVLDEHQAQKRHPADFLLWKTDATHLMRWDSPWGQGYPGWHIECSAMSASVLGREQIDIHTGGEDNIFPHHECEIAQSCGATGKPFFARYWLHARFLMVEGEKMSKSKGNFFTARQLFAQGIDPKVIRYELLKGHYRSNLNFTRKGLEDSARAVQRLRELDAKLKAAVPASAAPPAVDLTHPVLADFSAALADDLNIAGALGVLFAWLGQPLPDPALARAILQRIDSVLDVLNAAPVETATGLSEEQAAEKARQLDQARADKNFAAADALRKELSEAGYEVRSTRDGTTVHRKLI
ncbi:MAG: cysteine--tRNA ligase [Phycisphaeraceae bacterium]|nr:cysteine--tRNA ligase [Phycisphaeraceae bacterium]